MMCSQCSRPALYHIRGVLLCLEHANMVAQLEQNRHNAHAALMNFALDMMDEAVPTPGVPLPRYAVPNSTERQIFLGDKITNISISESVIGVLNTGEMRDVANNINQNVARLAKDGESQIAEAIKHLTEHVAQSGEIVDIERKEILERLNYLSEQAKLPSAERQNSVVKAVYDALMLSFTAVGSLASVWSTWGQVLTKML